MYSIRFNGRSDLGSTSARPDTGRSDHGEAPARPARDPIPPLINSLTALQPNKFRKQKEKGSKEKEALKILKDMIDQLWTLLGMFIAWVVLDGSAKTIVGYAIIGTLFAWAVTYPLRNPKDDE